MSKQTECHAPALPVAIESGRLLIDAHDQSDAMLQIAIDEAHALTYAEVLAPTDLGRWRELGGLMRRVPPPCSAAAVPMGLMAA